MRKILGPLLTVVLALGVGGAIYLSVTEQFGSTKIRGLIGSEKYAFFQDPRVVDALRGHGLEVHVQKAGSRQIATQFNLNEYDFAFPAGVPAAEKIRRETRVNKRYNVFFTPMVVASWKPIVQALGSEGVVQQRGNYHALNLPKLLELIIQEKRWNELSNNKDYNVNKAILLTSTDVRNSNSAAMYLALASYILNGNNIVSSEEQAQRLIGPLQNLFLRQGYAESSSAGPFNDYMVMGPGKSPLVMIYEAQFLYEAATENSGVSDKMLLLYPEPTLFSKHILIPFSAGGERLGEVLLNDPVLQELAIEHGLRNANTKAFRSFVERHKLAVPDSLVNVVEPPSYEILEHMIQQIEQRYLSGR